MALLLIDSGVKSGAFDKDGTTPLHGAVREVNVELARILIEQYGADVNAAGVLCGKTPLHVAADRRKESMVPMLSVLMEHGADINSVDKDGNTPLFVAASHGDLEVVRILAKHGADISAVNKDGNTPLFVAASYGT
jgi:ankyrin repeat protein